MYEISGILYLNQMKRTYQLIALQLSPNRRGGVDMEDGRGGGREGGRKRGRADEGGRKKEGSEAEPRKGESRPLDTL